jgi:hypothetical protein
MLKRIKKKSTKALAKQKLKKDPELKADDTKKKTIAELKKADSFNEKAQWKVFRELKAKVNKKIAKLKNDFKKNEDPQVLIEDINRLSLLGGECNYMLSQLEKVEKKSRKKPVAKKTIAKKKATAKK